MYQVACPACGAPVSFRSAASVMAVCSYCQSTLLRDAESVRDIGKMSAVIEDYSPLQIGTSGKHEGLAFGVVGRIQLQYEHGFWNEWYLVFDDGSNAWLADASGQYTLTRPVSPLDQAPLFDKISAGGRLSYGGQNYVAADVRSARCVAGQGELPFKVGEGWTAKVADLRCGTRFLSLDYSDSETPQVFAGSAVSLATLGCQLLREPEQIATSAGHLPGGAAAFECPACGASIAYRAGAAQHLVCPSCHAEVSAQPGQSEALAKHEALAQRPLALELGSVATIEGQKWTLIGAMERTELGDEPDPPWWEFLLYHPQQGFRWLVKTDKGWSESRVLDDWPQLSNSSARLGGRSYTQLFSYGAQVSWAAGAFNWRVHVGDQVQVTDFAAGEETLSAERDAHELVWSRSTRLPEATVMGWFGRAPAPSASKALAEPATSGGGWSLKKLALAMTVLLVVLNLRSLFNNFDDALGMLGFGAVLLWWPAFKFDGDSE